MPSLSDDLRAANAELVRRVRRDLAAFWLSLDLNRPEAARASLVAYLPVLTTLYGQAAATVAADWYDQTRAERGVAGLFLATPAAAFPAEHVRTRTEFGTRHLFTEDPEQSLAFLQGAAQKYALQPGRDTIVQATAADPKAAGWHRETR